MTKKHFILMAAVVRAILNGEWTNDFPPYGNTSRNISTQESGDENYTRAVWTAEAFIIIASQYNDRFDQNRFLIACGLKETPVKVRKSRKTPEVA